MTDEDESAFDEFLASRSTALLRTAILLCGASQHDAEDLVQGALEKVYRHWPRIRHDNPQAYARRVVVNAAISVARRRKVIQEITFARPPDTAVPPFDVDLRDALFAELQRLPTRMRPYWFCATGRSAGGTRPPRSWAVRWGASKARPRAVSLDPRTHVEPEGALR